MPLASTKGPVQYDCPGGDGHSSSLVSLSFLRQPSLLTASSLSNLRSLASLSSSPSNPSELTRQHQHQHQPPSTAAVWTAVRNQHRRSSSCTANSDHPFSLTQSLVAQTTTPTSSHHHHYITHSAASRRCSPLPQSVSASTTTVPVTSTEQSASHSSSIKDSLLSSTYSAFTRPDFFRRGNQHHLSSSFIPPTPKPVRPNRANNIGGSHPPTTNPNASSTNLSIAPASSTPRLTSTLPQAESDRPSSTPGSFIQTGPLSAQSTATVGVASAGGGPVGGGAGAKKKSDSISSLTGIGLGTITSFLTGGGSHSHSNADRAGVSTASGTQMNLSSPSSLSLNNNNSQASGSGTAVIIGSGSGSHSKIIRHITSTSTLSSLAINHSCNTNIHSINSSSGLSAHNPSSTMISLPKPSSDSTTLAASGIGGNMANQISGAINESNSSSVGGLTLRPGDVWSQVVLRVMPLFNGEGHKGFIEDLNEFVSQHIHKTISDSPSKCINKLNSDLNELFKSGMVGLNNKLQSDSLSDDRLLFRLIEVWYFFFTGVLPYLEGIFLPITTDIDLMTVIESKNNKVLQERLQEQHLLQQATTQAGLLSSSSSSILFRHNNRNQSSFQRHRTTGSQSSSRPEESIQAIDIRKLALIAFRDQTIQPIFSRLYYLFALLYDPTLGTHSSTINLSYHHTEQMHSQRLQMVGLLSSVQSEDSKQNMMEELGRLIRLGRSNVELLKMFGSTLEENHEVTRAKKVNENWENEQPRGDWNGARQRPERSPREDYNDDKPIKFDEQQIRGWNKNRDFARRSIRRQLGRNGTIKRPTTQNHEQDEDVGSRTSAVKSVGFTSHQPDSEEYTERNRARKEQIQSGVRASKNVRGHRADEYQSLERLNDNIKLSSSSSIGSPSPSQTNQSNYRMIPSGTNQAHQNNKSRASFEDNESGGSSIGGESVGSFKYQQRAIPLQYHHHQRNMSGNKTNGYLNLNIRPVKISHRNHNDEALSISPVL